MSRAGLADPSGGLGADNVPITPSPWVDPSGGDQGLGDLGNTAAAPAVALDGGPAAEALPLSQFAGEPVNPPAAHEQKGVWGFVNKLRYGGLPEPASWALIVIGFGMIGAALRGFVMANRKLAKLQSEDES